MAKNQKKEKKHSEKRSSYWIYAVIIVVLGAALYYISLPKKGDYDSFALCVADSGAKMYGTWWCPHCKEQKEDFGVSWHIMIENGGYEECANSDKSQTQVCQAAGITNYPTWRFPDGSEEQGKLSFFTIGNHTGCLQDLPLKSN